jgi:hypothetical protein
MARPEPLAPVGAPAEGTGAASVGNAANAAASGAPAPGPMSEAEQFFAPTVLQTGPQLPATTATSAFPSPYRTIENSFDEPNGTQTSRNPIVVGGVVLFLIAAIATAYFTLGPAAHKHLTPVVLAPKPPTNGLTTSLDDVVRMVAESSRRNALQAVESVGSGDLTQLKLAQPNYTYIRGDQASTDPQTVSVAQNQSTVTIAVSGSNKDICAYGRWAPGSTPVYVTMAHEPACAATTAPNVGWSTEPGGAASDLPDDPG